MAKIFLFLFLFILTVSAEEPPRVIIDETRYADLLEDPYSRRILGVIFHVGNGVGAYRFTEDEQADRRWFDEQGAKAFPVLLEVLKREPSPVDSPKSPEAWHGMDRKRRILDWTRHFPEGNLQPFIDEVRRQIAQLTGFRSSQWGHKQYLEEAFGLLALKGNESDIALMEKFLDDEDVGNRDNASASIAKLRARLDAEKAGQTAPAKDGPSSNQRVQAVDPDGNLLPPTPGNAAAMDTRIPLWLKWAISLLVVAGIFWHWRSRAKGKSKDGPAVK